MMAPTWDDPMRSRGAAADGPVGLPCKDTARALVLLASRIRAAGHRPDFLNGDDVGEDERRPWGVRSKKRVPQFVIGQVRNSWPSRTRHRRPQPVDALIDEAGRGGTPSWSGGWDGADPARHDSRTFTTSPALHLACIKDMALDTVTDRPAALPDAEHPDC